MDIGSVAHFLGAAACGNASRKNGGRSGDDHRRQPGREHSAERNRRCGQSGCDRAPQRRGQAAYEKSLHPTLLQGWAGGANIGFALTAGNSETKNLALAFTADRKTSHDEIALYTNTIYATNDAPGAVPPVTANATQGGARYDRNFTKRLFGFGSADFQTDALQNLNLRSVLGGGLGFHAINTDRTTLDFLGGLNYTKENYVGLDRNFAALTLGEELMHKLGASTVLSQKLYFFPNLSDSGQYRATFNLGTITKISKWLGWQNAFGDIYVTNPPVGKRTNDLQLTTGINVSFTH